MFRRYSLAILVVSTNPYNFYFLFFIPNFHSQVYTSNENAGRLNRFKFEYKYFVTSDQTNEKNHLSLIICCSFLLRNQTTSELKGDRSRESWKYFWEQHKEERLELKVN